MVTFKIDGFDVTEMTTSTGKKLLVDVGDRDYSKLDNFIRSTYNVVDLLVSDDIINMSRKICYKIKGN